MFGFAHSFSDLPEILPAYLHDDVNVHIYHQPLIRSESKQYLM